MIAGVEIKQLKAHHDDRGFFCELIRTSDPFFQGAFAQLSHAMVHTGVLKAWHMHEKQTDWTCVIAGEVLFGMYDFRRESPTYGQRQMLTLGEYTPRQVVKVPPGIAHGYKVLRGPAHVIYVMNREYDPTDEIRIDYNDPRIGYDWTV